MVLFRLYVGHGLKYMVQVFKEFEVVFFGGLYYRVDHRAAFRPFRGAAEEPVFSSYDEWFYAAFSTVVGDFYSAVHVEGLKEYSLFKCVVQRFSQGGLRQCADGGGPREEGVRYRFAFLKAFRMSFFGGEFFVFSFKCKEFVAVFKSGLRERVFSFYGRYGDSSFVELSSGVRPAAASAYGAVEFAIAGVAVRVEAAFKAAEEFFRMDA